MTTHEGEIGLSLACHRSPVQIGDRELAFTTDCEWRRGLQHATYTTGTDTVRPLA